MRLLWTSENTLEVYGLWIHKGYTDIGYLGYGYRLYGSIEVLRLVTMRTWWSERPRRCACWGGRRWWRCSGGSSRGRPRAGAGPPPRCAPSAARRRRWTCPERSSSSRRSPPAKNADSREPSQSHQTPDSSKQTKNKQTKKQEPCVNTIRSLTRSKGGLNHAVIRVTVEALLHQHHLADIKQTTYTKASYSQNASPE